MKNFKFGNLKCILINIKKIKKKIGMYWSLGLEGIYCCYVIKKCIVNKL